jgi:hypothetical protein
MLRPLTDALQGSPRPKKAVEWTAERRTAFKVARAALGKATNLAYPKMGADLGLMVDASANHVGAALQQRAGPAAGWQPLGFFSKKLDQHLRGGPHQQLDSKVRHPRHHHLGPGKPVHLVNLGRHLLTVGGSSTAYHPQSNGMVERVHWHLKEGLKGRGAQVDWPQHLPWVLLNMRTAPKTQSNTSAAEMVYGVALTLPAQLPSPTETTLAAVEQQREEAPILTRELLHPTPTEVPAHLATAGMVYVRKGGQPLPLAPPYSGPYRVMSRGPKYFSIDIGGQQQAVTVDRLKLHTGTAASTPAAPPRRGRPPVARPPPQTTPPSPPRRAPSPGLPATTSARQQN